MRDGGRVCLITARQPANVGADVPDSPIATTGLAYVNTVGQGLSPAVASLV